MLATRDKKTRKSPTALPEGSVGELVEFVCPGVMTRRELPLWPPDAFALAALLLEHSSAYTRVLPEFRVGAPQEAEGELERLLEEDWPETASRVGAEWRAGLAATPVALPAAVKECWRIVRDCRGVPLAELGRRRRHPELCRALLRLLGFADEAAAGFGWTPGAEDVSGAAVALQLLRERRSLCRRIDPAKARVLPKCLSPRRGLSLRSLSRHLALISTSEVAAHWLGGGQADGDRGAAGREAHFPERPLFNLLLLPWPLRVETSAFRLLAIPGMADHDRVFAFDPPAPSMLGFRKALGLALEQARRCVDRVDAIVFPELALSFEEYEAAEAIAMAEGSLLIAGVRLRPGQIAGEEGGNICLIQLGGLDRAGQDAGFGAEVQDAGRILQRKHHRWCLDREQIEQYGLGGVLPASKDCWEATPLAERGLHFFGARGWLNLSVLLCEDLARQDPVAEVLRAVGPGLVVALLMDGPQVGERWPARYSAALTEDPGCSVLTLTNLGMVRRSRAEPGHEDRPGVIGMWRDVEKGCRELELGPQEDGAVLSIDYHLSSQLCADGRRDQRGTPIPTLSGYFPLTIGALACLEP